jgi:hypothetical protein
VRWRAARPVHIFSPAINALAAELGRRTDPQSLEMNRPARYALVGAMGGAVLGVCFAVAAWRHETATGRPVAFALEAMSVFVAPPFGLLLSYPIAALTGLGHVGFVLWSVLTPATNWALVGLGAGAIRNIRASNAARRRESRPSV